MATITGFETPKVIEPEPPLVVDINIAEYLYVADLNDILGDDNLVKLIITNPYYQQIICEANEMAELRITLNGQEYTFRSGKPDDVESTLAMLEGKTKYAFPDTIIINLR